ncbi:MAG: sulfurtransferase-like selenium metabolism protein YedF, partial [Deltaproteobacteria bacterium]
MAVEIDCRGLACPAPVLQTKEAIEAKRPDIIRVIVDNEASKQNVIRFLESQGFALTVEMNEPDIHV